MVRKPVKVDIEDAAIGGHARLAAPVAGGGGGSGGGGGGGAIEDEIVAIGETLRGVLSEVLEAAVRAGSGPVAAGRELGVDKVLMSRVLKALRATGTVEGLSAMPGPEPLRRLVGQAALKEGVSGELRARADAAIDQFEILIKVTIGDRSRLDSLLSSWAPGTRREFELRRKQAAFKAMSQIKGVQANVSHATVLLSPSEKSEWIDVVWINGNVGLARLRAGAVVNFASRRLSPAADDRRPMALDGKPIGAGEVMLVKEFCSVPTPLLDVRRVGESVFYSLRDGALGSAAAVDLVYAEVNRAEIPRTVPKGSGRKGYFFAEVNIPSVVLQFDVIVHRDLYSKSLAPELVVYDTSFQGIASVNDRARDVDRLDLLEKVDSLGGGYHGGIAAGHGREAGTGAFSSAPGVAASDLRLYSADMPRYGKLVRLAAESIGVKLEECRGFRCRIDYPVYGSQVTMAFDGEE